MKKQFVFNQTSLTQLPFNYQYIECSEKNEGIQQLEMTYNPLREFAIDSLKEPIYLCSHPEKPISKLYKPIQK